MRNNILIQILYFPDCPIYKELEKLIKEVVQELGVDADLELINIRTKEDAEKYHFTGSPGLRINGEDIDPLTKNAPVVLKSCKIYRTEEGMKMIPTKKMIKEVLEKFQQPDSTISCCS